MATRHPTSKAELDARFSELYRAHLRDVYSYSYYRVGNHHDAEDLTEQTFLQAYRHFERALRESDGRPLRPWLIRIAHNLAANFYRDRARKPESAIEDAGMISAPHTTESLVEGREELKAILAGVQQLPDDRREALIMRFALGMDNREIARALGRTDGATKVLLHRAIRQLEGIVAERARPETRGVSPQRRGAAARGARRRSSRPRASRRTARGDARQHHRARPGGARELGAVGDARSAQLGSSGRCRGRHRHRGQRAGRVARARSAIAPASRSRRTCWISPSARFADIARGDPADPARPLSSAAPATAGQCRRAR